MVQRKTPRKYEAGSVTRGQIKQLSAIAVVNIPTDLSFRHAQRLIKGGLETHMEKMFGNAVSSFEKRPSRFVDVSRVYTVNIAPLRGEPIGTTSMTVRYTSDVLPTDLDMSDTVADVTYLHVFNSAARESDFMQDAEEMGQAFTLHQFLHAVNLEYTRCRMIGLRCRLRGMGKRIAGWALFDEQLICVNEDFGTGIMRPEEAYMFRFPR